jgi:hypothetical protein
MLRAVLGDLPGSKLACRLVDCRRYSKIHCQLICILKIPVISHLCNDLFYRLSFQKLFNDVSAGFAE